VKFLFGSLTKKMLKSHATYSIPFKVVISQGQKIVIFKRNFCRKTNAEKTSLFSF